MVLFQSLLDQATGNYAGKNEGIDSKDMKQMVFGQVLTKWQLKKELGYMVKKQYKH